MDRINFRLIFDRGMCKMDRYVMAFDADDARHLGEEIAWQLCTEGLDTFLVKVLDQADEEYYS